MGAVDLFDKRMCTRWWREGDGLCCPCNANVATSKPNAARGAVTPSLEGQSMPSPPGRVQRHDHPYMLCVLCNLPPRNTPPPSLHVCRAAAQGRGAGTVFRDKVTGRLLTEEEFAAQRASEKRKKPPREEVHLEWRGGLAQQRAAAEAAAAVAREAQKAFGRWVAKGRWRWTRVLMTSCLRNASLGQL